MSFKAEIETAIHISRIHIRNISNPGVVQYRIGIYYHPRSRPHKIFFVPQNIDNTMRTVHQRNNEPQIELDCCYSQKYQVHYSNQPIRDETTYYFKAYIDKQLLRDIDLYVGIDLLYGINFENECKVIKTFQAKIGRHSNIFEYLPISFDPYGTISMDGTYHATLLAYKFEKNQDESPFIENEYSSFYQYLQNSTLGYRPFQIINFCDSYRENMETELNSLQQRLGWLSKITKNAIKGTTYTKISCNRKINKLLSSQSKKSVSLNSRELVADIILEDILNIKVIIYSRWNEFNELLKMNSHRAIRKLKGRYDENIKIKLLKNVQTIDIKFHDWTFNKYPSHNHMQQVQDKQNQQEKSQNEEEAFLIKDTHFFSESINKINIFEQVYETGNLPHPSPVPEDYEHIVFLVHGFQAHRNDFLDFKLCLESRLNVKIYISSANIDKTEESMDNMGARLSMEVKRYLETVKKSFKISFIGHSMGGIIIRSALKYLKSLEAHFHAYISLCSPHLGYLYGSSTLVQAGLWYMNNFDKYTSMLELTMQDRPKLRQTFLYKLSKQEQLNKFQKITFIASSQDEYVPYSSARSQKNSTSLSKDFKNRQEREVLCEMVDNLLCSVEASQITRIDVIFSIKESTFDTFIGRTGHVKFLCDEHFLKHFAITLDHLLL